VFVTCLRDIVVHLNFPEEYEHHKILFEAEVRYKNLISNKTQMENVIFNHELTVCEEIKLFFFSGDLSFGGCNRWGI